MILRRKFCDTSKAHERKATNPMEADNLPLRLQNTTTALHELEGATVRRFDFLGSKTVLQSLRHAIKPIQRKYTRYSLR